MRNFLFFLFITLGSTIKAQNINGLWFGNLQVAGQNLSLELYIKPDAKSVLVDVRGEQSYPTDIDELNLKDSILSFSVTKLNVTYKGVFNGESFSGTFKQSTITAPLNFHREKPKPKEVNRPQNPIEPFDYSVLEVSFLNEVGGFNLSGTLTIPKEDSTLYPIILLASGSGAQNRNEEMMGHKPFLVLADYLTNNGIGVLRFDDRGYGASGGQFYGASFYDFSTDLESAVKYIKSNYPNHPVGILGHSEGGAHALILSEREEIDYLLFFACVGTSGYQVIKQQNYDLLVQEGNKKDGKWAAKSMKILKKVLAENESKAAARRVLKEKLQKHYNKASEKIKEQATFDAYFKSLITQMNNDYGRSFLSFEAQPYLKQYDGKVFAINGSKDIQVNAKSNLKAFEKYAPKEDLFVKAYPGLNHLFQKCETCTVLEYGEIEQTISTEVLEDLTRWINAVSNK